MTNEQAQAAFDAMTDEEQRFVNFLIPSLALGAMALELAILMFPDKTEDELEEAAKALAEDKAKEVTVMAIEMAVAAKEADDVPHS